jgi:aspartyl-tRNA(Asn)/glutamyl-tRNA(Gln) amidotransferase subunit A
MIGSGDPAFLSLAEQAALIASGDASSFGLVERCLTRIAEHDGELGAYLRVDAAAARMAAEDVDRRRAAGQALPPLAGVPISLKDNLVTAGMATTAGSKILEGWVPPYDATVVSRLRAAGAIILGKTNLDEFGMGSSTEHSAYHPTRNPWDPERVPGGSSGGSAAAVAAGLCAASLGTDTGGSIRQPAAFCGVVGLKPTYGRVSRWGLIAYASSLDQIGPITRTVEDAALLLEIIAGHDPRDATSLPTPVPPMRAGLKEGVAGLRIGLPREYFADGIDPEVRTAVDYTAHNLREAGATVIGVSLRNTAAVLPTYYLIAPAEASSNLARYDGVRFGLRVEAPGGSLLDMYRQTRGAGFGPEVKRRIMLGTYALRAGFYDAYYKKAQQVRALIKADFDEAFSAVDVLLTPTTPTPAFRFGAKATPYAMYLADIFTLSANLAGLPAMSVPCGQTVDGLPIGVQLIGQPCEEATMLKVAAKIEATAPEFGRPALVGGPP